MAPSDDDAPTPDEAPARRRFAFPTPYTVLFAVIALAALATWAVPAGRYDTLRYDGEQRAFLADSAGVERTLPPTQATLDRLGVAIALGDFTGGGIKKPVALPGTYHRTAGDPQGVLDVLRAPILGLYDAIDIVLFVLVIGGFIGVFNRTGAFGVGIAALTRRLRGREAWLIVVVMALMALGGTTFGMSEETVAFFPLLVPVFLAAGYDRLVPVAAIFVGATIGSMASTTNPFATVIASDAAGVAWTDGLGGRIGLFVVGLALATTYVVRYATRVRADPARSLVRGGVAPALAAAIPPPDAAAPGLSNRRANVLLVFFGAVFVTMVVGVSRLGWWFPEMTALFLGAAIVVGIAQRGGEAATVSAFLDGARDLLGVAFVIGLARGATLVLDRGEASGTILHAATGLVSGMPGVAFLLALLAAFAVLALFIQSSSGLAVLTMPIVGGLADVAGVPRSAVVDAYLLGLGITGLLTPSGMVLPSLEMGKVDYGAWLRFALPLVGLLTLLAVAALTLRGLG